MDKETLRMQMLAGVITEGQYKEKVEKLAEGAFDNPYAPKIAEPQKGGSLQLKNAAMKIYSYIKKNGFTPYLMVDGKNIGDRMNHDFAIQVQGAGGTGASSSLAADGLLTISGNQNKTNPQVMEKLQNDIIHDFSFLTKHYQSNPSRLVIRLAVDPKANVSEELDEKDSLNESMIGGIVGVGAINTIPPRAKTDYEDAFEYFLSQKYELKEEINEDEKPSKEELEEIGVGAVLGGAAIAALAKKAYGAYKNYALKKGMKETGEEKKGSNGIIAKEYMSEKDGKTYWGITYQDDTRDSGYEKPRMFLFTPEKIDKVLNTDLKFATSDEDMMADGADQKLGQFIADKVVMLEGEKDSLNEHYVAGGIVGIGAINQIPSHAKADYEDAFEYFLSQKYPLNEEESVEEDLNEADAIAIKKIDDKIQNDPEFLKKTKEAMAKAEKGNTTDLASLMAGFGKMFEADELEEGKEVEEKTNY